MADTGKVSGSVTGVGVTEDTVKGAQEYLSGLGLKLTYTFTADKKPE